MVEAQSPTMTITGSPVTLGNRYEIFPDSPLPQLNAAGGRAFAARLRGNELANQFYAIICDGTWPPRVEITRQARLIRNPSLTVLMESGTVDWPLDGGRRFALLYEPPVGPRLLPRIEERWVAPSEEIFNRTIVMPMLAGLRDYHRSQIAHGALRPTNLFARDGLVQLGECLSAPCGVGQLGLCETIERLMVRPAARGEAKLSDDMYALGATFAILLFGLPPDLPLDDTSILKAKLERGSYSLLVGHGRPSSGHIELLRGLLTDDVAQRWTTDDLDMWENGRRLTPKQASAGGKRAVRAFRFKDQDFWHVRPLARAMAQHPADAAPLLQGPEFPRWLKRSLGDEALGTQVENLLEQLRAAGLSTNADQLLTARVLMVLDPSAPIQYKDLAFLPSGFPTLLAEAAQTGVPLQSFAEVLLAQLPSHWLEQQSGDVKQEQLSTIQQLDRVRRFVERATGIGGGLERVIYELNPGLPCLSPLVRNQHVLSVRELLTALDRVAPGRPAREPMDRHIAAFVAARERRIAEQFYNVLGSDDAARRALAMLSILNEIQFRSGPERVPQLAEWLASLQEPVILRFHYRPRREELRGRLRDVAGEGVLARLLDLVDSPATVAEDQQGFEAAQLLYLASVRRIAMLRQDIEDREGVAQRVGQPLAALVATILSVGIVFLTLLQGGTLPL